MTKKPKDKKMAPTHSKGSVTSPLSQNQEDSSQRVEEGNTLKAGWEMKKLGEIAEIINGKNQSNVISEKGKYPIYGSAGSLMGYATDYLCDAGTTIIGRKGNISSPIFIQEKFWNVDTAFGLYPKNGYSPKFFNYLCQTIDFKSRNRGTTIPSLVKSDLMSIDVPFICSLAEQKRIVAILDKCFAVIEKAKSNAEQNLKNAKELFDSTLLYAAIGSITKDWRKKQKGIDKVAHSELNYLINEKGTKISRSEDTIGHEIITDSIPKEWALTSIESIFNLIDYRGKNPPRSNKGHRLITAKNIKMGYISEQPITFVSELTYKKWMVRGFPNYGDILFVTEGHTMGFVALNTRTDNFALAQRTITLQPTTSFNTKFFFYFMMSSYFQNLIKLNATGAAAVGIKGSKLRSLPLPYPSIAEQQAIVKKLDALSSETKKLEAIYQKKIHDLEELKKSILQKAFNGEL